MTWEDDQKGIIDKADIFDNLLSHLDNVAYKIKFFMIHPDHPIGVDDLDEVYLKKVNTIIIAETGVTTGFYIKDMGFTNAVAAKLQLTPLGITGQLNIIEPFGMSLYEKLVIAAQTLGCKNHLEARYIIQLTFTGHTPSGEQIRVPFKWMVPVILQKMTSTITEQGSDYTLQWVGMNQFGSTNITSSAKEPIIVTARTFGEFIDEYTEALNNHQDDLVKNKAQMYQDTYKFKFDKGHPDHPTPAPGSPWTDPTETQARGFVLGGADAESQKLSRKRDNAPYSATTTVERPVLTGEAATDKKFIANSPVNISTSVGSNITSVVQGVFMQTVEMKKRTKPGGDASVTMSKKEFKKLSKKHKQIEGIADIGSNYEGWSDFKNKWYMSISTEIKNGEWAPIRNRYARHITHILHQFRVLHAIADGGEARSKRDPANIKQTTIDKMNALVRYGLLRKAYYWIYTGLNAEVLNFTFNFDNLYYVATPTFPASSVGGRTTQSGEGDQGGNKSQARESTVKNVRSDKKPSAAKFHAATGTWTAGYQPFKMGPESLEDRYLEDLPLRQTNMAAMGDAPFSNPSYLPDIVPRDLIQGVGAGGLRAVADPNRIVYNINSGDMMELSLTIKGDPFWLGHTTGIVNVPPPDHAPYSNGANYLYIEFNVPQGVDPDSGQMVMGAANNISGIYFITNVQSNFSDGQFTQSLTGYLDTTFGLSVIRGMLANN